MSETENDRGGIAPDKIDLIFEKRPPEKIKPNETLLPETKRVQSAQQLLNIQELLEVLGSLRPNEIGEFLQQHNIVKGGPEGMDLPWIDRLNLGILRGGSQDNPSKE